MCGRVNEICHTYYAPDGGQERGGWGGEGGLPLLRDLVIQRGLEPGVDPVIVDDDEDDGQLVPGDRLHLQPGEPERGVALHADHLPRPIRGEYCVQLSPNHSSPWPRGRTS